MVHLIEADRDTVQTELLQKKIVCFGTGRRFAYFRKGNPKIPIVGAIDNYKSSDWLDMGNEQIPVWFPEEVSVQIDRDTIIVITSLAIEEIVDQMDKMEKFNGLSCYAEAALDGYVGLDDKQRLWMEKLVSRLAHRTYESILRENYGEANLGSEIKKYQVWEYIGISDTAGSKARTDIKEVIGNLGYQVVNMHCSNGNRGMDAAEGCDRLVQADWAYFLDMLPEYSIAFMQLPAPSEMRFPKDMMLQMKGKKHIRFACFIHDVDSLRRSDVSPIRREEFEMIKEMSDFLVVHNNVMKKYFEESGIEGGRIITLQIFDYLHKGLEHAKRFEKAIIFAGNLSKEKSPFLGQLGKLSPLKVRLYGPGFAENILFKADNVDYCGTFPAELLPQQFDSGFGLVWDGNSLDTCAGGTGEYLRYNNPHKMSLYLSAGLPVIIWSGAAQAGFVRKKQVGLVVDSLYEIKDILDGMDEESYSVLVENAKKLSRQLRSGYYTRMAVKRVEEAIENG